MKRIGKPTLTGDERDEFAHALLHALLGFLSYFRVVGQSQLHDTGNCIVLLLVLWSKITVRKVKGNHGVVMRQP